MLAKRTKVVVIGAGFGGLSAVHALAKKDIDVILIDRSNHHLFQPLLYQVATAALDPSDIASPIRSIFAKRTNVEVILGDVNGIDAKSKTVSVTDVGAIDYDQLVIATGAVSSWFGHDDWAEHSVGLKSLRDAGILRQRLLCAFERAETCSDPEEIRRLLTFVVVGGGPAVSNLRVPSGRWRTIRSRPTSGASNQATPVWWSSKARQSCSPVSRSACRLMRRRGCGALAWRCIPVFMSRVWMPRG